MATKELIKQEAVQVIPSAEMKGLEQALGALKQEAAVLPSIQVKAATLVVDTPERYGEAGTMLTQVRSIKKAGGFRIGPFLEIARQVTDFLRNERIKHENQCAIVEGILENKMQDFKRWEREAAAAEQRRINEEGERHARAEAEAKRKEAEAQAEADRKKREKEISEAQKAGKVKKREADRLRKEAEEAEARQKQLAAEEAAKAAENFQTVTVLPSVPKVAGIRARLNWKFRIVDVNLIPRQYLIPDEKEIGQMVRHRKDKAKAEASCPGIEVYTEDSV